MLGDNIKRLRLSKGIGLNETARRANITGGYLSSIENNKRTNVGTETLQSIADAIGVSISEFYNDNILNDIKNTIKKETTNDMIILGDKIKNLRKKEGLTQQALASAVGVSRSTIGMLEKNLQGVGNETLIKLADFFNVSVDYLLKNEGIEETQRTDNEIKLTDKDKKDIEKSLEQTLNQLEKQEGLMLSGNPVDENDWEFIKSAIKNGLEYAKKVNKEKYTPKKYKK